MHVYLRFSVLVLLVLTRVLTIKADTDDDPGCENQRFIVDQHKDTREIVKIDLDTMFGDLSNSINKKLETIELKMEQLKIIESKMETVLSNLSGSFHQKLAAIESKLEISHSEIQKIDESVADLSLSFRRSLSKLSPQVTIVEDLKERVGIIDYHGRGNSHLRRKMWIIRADPGENERLRVQFNLEEEKLGQVAQLSIFDGMGHEGAYSAGSGATYGGMGLFVVTLTMSNSKTITEPASFKLRFNVTKEFSANLHSSVVMKDDGIHFLSFPTDNKQTYPLKSVFQAVIAPSSGKQFRLTMKYLDVPEASECNDIRVWFLEDSPGKKKFVERPYSAFSHCGRLGNITQVIGHSSVAIVRFYPPRDGSETGKGFRMEVDNSD